MNGPVESQTVPPRPTRRHAQAAATRELIVGRAERLFLSQGYLATTIDAIAEEAGVAVQTIYNSVGNKAAILSAVVDKKVVDREATGPQGEVPMGESMSRRIAAAADYDAVIAVLADRFAEVNARLAALNDVIAQAAMVDKDVRELDRARGLRRLRRYGQAAVELRARGGLRVGMSDADAAAVIWTVGSPQTYRSLVGDFGWDQARYRGWVYSALHAALW